MQIANKIENKKDIENDISTHEKENDDSRKNENTLTPYILLLALSLHGIFEGIALGVINNNSECIILFIAIIAHKWAESFALGISFYNARIHTKCLLKCSPFLRSLHQLEY
jgi:zinc transporter 1/2/3